MSTGSHQEDKTVSIEGIPPTWQSTPVNYLFRIVGGDGFAPELQGESSGDLPFLKNSDISSGITRISTAANYVSHALARREGFSLVPPKSILMGKIGESMKKNHRVLNTVACCIDNNMQAMVPDVRLITPEYGLYALKLLNATDFNNGGPVPSINNVKWKRARIPIPLLHEQRLIANVLDDKLAKIDQAMSLLRRELETMEQLKKSLIYEAVTKGLDPTVPMKPSGVDWIGDIPEHWEAKKLKFIANFGSGTTPDSGDYSYYDDGEIPWIQSGDLYRNPRITRTEKNVTTKAIRELSALTVYRAPFVVVAMYGASVGNTSLSEIDAFLNQACCYIRGNHHMRNEYSFYAISSARSDLISKAQGGTQPNISQIVLKNQVIPIPPISEQGEIIRYLRAKCSSLDRAAKLKQNQMEILANQRKSLVFEYVTGKRRASEVA
ncbi:MAG: restriction endonuclease subunit S [Actinomyces sp.]|nr:restriction endonuclease subunit S [Actinomyces sp.]